METSKVPLKTVKVSWAAQHDSLAVSLANAAGIPAPNNKASATYTRTPPSYDGTTDPGPPGEPV